MANYEIYRAGDGGKFTVVQADGVLIPSGKDAVWQFYSTSYVSDPIIGNTNSAPVRRNVAVFQGILGYKEVGGTEGFAQPVPRTALTP